MKIIIDIGHPAHVHYFRKLIILLKQNGNQVLIIARNKDITFYLLKKYNLDFIDRGKGKNGGLGKIIYLFKGSRIVYKIARKNKIDIFLSFASPYNSIASFFLKKPSIVLDDTEHNRFNHVIYKKFSDVSLHPVDFKKQLSKKQLFFDGTMENAYLLGKVFSNNSLYNTSSKTKKVLIRFVAWKASHDKLYSGFTYSDKLKLISKLEHNVKLYISSESELPDNLKKYKLNIEPEKFHDFLATVDLYVGESGSIATEAAFLGIPSIILNSAAKYLGVFSRFEKRGMLYIAENGSKAIDKACDYLEKNKKNEAQLLGEEYRNEAINLTKLLQWFVEHYPDSAQIMKKNPDYQYIFK